MSAATALAVSLLLIGAVGASAWTFATKASPQRAIYNGVSYGDGAGAINRFGLATINIDVELKDPVNNGNPVYQETRAWKPADPGWTGATATAGYRSGSSWAAMSRKTINTVKSSVGSWASSKVCEKQDLRPDICSVTKTSAL
ncbi:hypothetical protein G8C93_15130 [Cellulosimicrobium cellulans]|uniref:hypothetical protein n=1 Tax=Cellulosimicrobium cellulans TaxID=1710 RepID=UPI001883A351|nr:hypothetical protein [Cellulosimicrobium cellulans]MBE9927217.1 hypothetical protein [Cellulosimicrobium cellulans]